MLVIHARGKYPMNQILGRTLLGKQLAHIKHRPRILPDRETGLKGIKDHALIGGPESVIGIDIPTIKRIPLDSIRGTRFFSPKTAQYTI